MDFDSAVVISANGGGGGGGQPTLTAGLGSTPGSDGAAGTSSASGGIGESSGGNGGRGATGSIAASAGEYGTTVLVNAYGGGGGGGGGVGRIHINNAPDCAVRGELSPPPAVECPGCELSCPRLPTVRCRHAVFAEHSYVFCDDSENWSTAADFCEAVGLGLVRIDGPEEDAFVLNEIGSETWLGASDIDEEGQWRWRDDGTQFWMGDATGSAVEDRYSAWGLGEPGPALTDQDCLSTRPGLGWQDSLCEGLRAYACE